MKRAAAIARDLVLLFTLAAGAGYLYLSEGKLPGAPIVRPSARAVAPAETVVGSSEGLSEGLSGSGLIFQLNQTAVDLAQIEEYRLAAEQLARACDLSPEDEVLKRNLQTVLLNWGTSELLAGNLDEADELLHRAAALGERAEVLRVLGILLHKKHDFAAAATVLEQALSLLPRDGNVLLALGDSYLRQEQRQQAFDVLTRAREVGMHSADLNSILQRLGREIDAEWDFVNLRTPHFQASFGDSEEHGSVRMVLDGLEDAYTTVGRKFGHFPEASTPVVLYAQEDFHSATLTPDWAGGAFDGRIKVPLRGLTADDPGLVRSLRHEYAHSIIATLAGPACPVWLNEGLAVWAEQDQEGERADWALDTIAKLGTFRFDDLDRAFVSLPGSRVESAYAQSYLVVNALVDHYGNQGLRDFLDALRRNQDPEQALAELYGDSWTGLLESVIPKQ